MKLITISKKNLQAILVMALVLITCILVIDHWPISVHENSSDNPVEPDPASTAAVAALEAFFQVDYRQGQDGWLAQVCELSTPAGCELLQLTADPMWAKFQAEETMVDAKVQAEKLLRVSNTEQVWQMSIQLSAPLPGSNKTEDIAYISLINTPGGWKFDRFLLAPEVQAILAATIVSPVPTASQVK